MQGNSGVGWGGRWGGWVGWGQTSGGLQRGLHGAGGATGRFHVVPAAPFCGVLFYEGLPSARRAIHKTLPPARRARCWWTPASGRGWCPRMRTSRRCSRAWLGRGRWASRPSCPPRVGPGGGRAWWQGGERRGCWVHLRCRCCPWGAAGPGLCWEPAPWPAHGSILCSSSHGCCSACPGLPAPDWHVPALARPAKHPSSPEEKAGPLCKSTCLHAGIDDFDNVSVADVAAALPVIKGLGVPLLIHAELVDDDVPTGVSALCCARCGAYAVLRALCIACCAWCWGVWPPTARA